jgi:predicted secreted protein
MATIRGNDGLVALGGYLVGSAFVDGAVSNGASAATFDDNAGSGLTGALLTGDEFTVAGDAQDPYVIAATALVGETVANEVDVTFTPTVQEAGGWADNAAVTFTAAAIACVKSFELDVDRQLLDATCMRATGRQYVAGFQGWNGRIRVLLDSADTETNALITGATGQTTSEVSLTLVAEDGTQYYGYATITRSDHRQETDALVEVEFEVQGRGAIALQR